MAPPPWDGGEVVEAARGKLDIKIGAETRRPNISDQMGT